MGREVAEGSRLNLVENIQRTRSLTTIVKPTHACNLRCRYCYLEGEAESGRMTSAIVERMTKQLAGLDDRNRLNFIWHGGEPLLMPLGFYEEVVEIQKKFGKGKCITNSFQTNATLITDDVLDFCERNDFSIGTSLDGPREINDLTRVYADGSGSFDDVWKGIQRVRRRNEEIAGRTEDGKRPLYLGGGPIVVLSRKNVGRLREIYDFFKSQDLAFKINPLIKSGRAREGYEELGIEPLEYGRAMVMLFDRWFAEEEEGIDLDPLSEMMGSVMSGKPAGCNFKESCRDSFISIGPNGDVYPCGRFDGVKEYHLGNINDSPLAEMLSSPKHVSMHSRSASTVKGCSGCKYSPICNAGCMHNAYMRRGDIMDKDYYCPSYKLLFDHLEKAIKPELEKAVQSSGSITLPVLNLECVKGGNER